MDKIIFSGHPNAVKLALEQLTNRNSKPIFQSPFKKFEFVGHLPLGTTSKPITPEIPILDIPQAIDLIHTDNTEILIVGGDYHSQLGFLVSNGVDREKIQIYPMSFEL